jgi:hypothetical protein
MLLHKALLSRASAASLCKQQAAPHLCQNSKLFVVVLELWVGNVQLWVELWIGNVQLCEALSFDIGLCWMCRSILQSRYEVSDICSGACDNAAGV